MLMAFVGIPRPLRMRRSFSGVAVAVIAAKGTPGMLYRKVSSFAKSVRNSLPLNGILVIGY